MGSCAVLAPFLERNKAHLAITFHVSLLDFPDYRFRTCQSGRPVTSCRSLVTGNRETRSRESNASSTGTRRGNGGRRAAARKQRQAE